MKHRPVFTGDMTRLVIWVDPSDCDPPHGLDMTSQRDAGKVNALAEEFVAAGFDENMPALIGYPLNGRIQLLSGTHRHRAATQTSEKLPLVLWLRSDIEESWGDLLRWTVIMKDYSVAELGTWTREDIERRSLAGGRI